MVSVAVMGYGVVGSGTVEVFYKNHESLVKKCGGPVEITRILDPVSYTHLDVYKRQVTLHAEGVG